MRCQFVDNDDDIRTGGGMENLPPVSGTRYHGKKWVEYLNSPSLFKLALLTFTRTNANLANWIAEKYLCCSCAKNRSAKTSDKTNNVALKPKTDKIQQISNIL